MPTWTDADADCLVFTYKEGLLSRVAHDLKLRVGRFRIEADGGAGTASASFDAASLRVVCALKNGRETPGALSDKDRAQIEETTRQEVLRSDRWPEVRFTARTLRPHGSGWWVAGTLELCGRSGEVQAVGRRQGDRLVFDASLHQPDWGIEPYSAMMGTMRIQPRIDVRLTVPAP